MTETHPVSESYESLRDSVENVEACAAWNDADRRTAVRLRREPLLRLLSHLGSIGGGVSYGAL
jgi:hypothetical protein